MKKTYYIGITANGVSHTQHIETDEDLIILLELFKKLERNVKTFIESQNNYGFEEEHF